MSLSEMGKSSSFGRLGSNRVRDWRLQAGMSQSEFARYFGIPLKTLQAWEQGSRAPSPYVVCMMQSILRLDRRSDDHVEILYGLLRDYFSADDIVYEYSDDAYMPVDEGGVNDDNFVPTFYIRSRDLYIELFTSQLHGRGWFDPDDEDDNERYRDRSAKRELYDYIHGARDVSRREYAKASRLNYVVFWTIQDVYDWFYLGCPDGQDWDVMWSWRTPLAFNSVLSGVVEILLDNGSVRFDAEVLNCRDHKFEYETESLLETPDRWDLCTLVFDDARLLPGFYKVYLSKDRSELCIDNGGSLIYYKIVEK